MLHRKAHASRCSCFDGRKGQKLSEQSANNTLSKPSSTPSSSLLAPRAKSTPFPLSASTSRPSRTRTHVSTFGMSADRIRLGLFGDTTSLVCGHVISSFRRHEVKAHELVNPPLQASRNQEFQNHKLTTPTNRHPRSHLRNRLLRQGSHGRSQIRTQPYHPGPRNAQRRPPRLRQQAGCRWR